MDANFTLLTVPLHNFDFLFLIDLLRARALQTSLPGAVYQAANDPHATLFVRSFQTTF